MSELRTIRLYGHLGKRFGRVHRRAIASPHEAIKALCATLPGFREYVQVTHGKQAFRVVVGKEDIGVDQLRDISGGQEISIVPVVRGGKSDFGRVITGAALIAIAIWNPMGWAAMGTQGAWGLSTMYGAGVSMALGGIAGMLAATPSANAYGAGDDNGTKNYLFSGAGQATKAGGCVPVLYGELEIPCVPISTGIRADYGSSAASCGMPGDGAGAWSGDGNTTPKAASKAESEYTATWIETATRMYAISEGPCDGLVGGWKGIKLDGTPVLASDGTTWNFTGISAALVNGTQTQAWIPGFPDVETETVAGGEIKHDQPQYITVNDLSVGAVRIRITFPSLQKIDSTTGKAVSATVQLAIDVQSSGGSYVDQQISGTISGSYSSETSRTFTVPLTGTGPWTIRVRRVTADSTDTYTSDKSYLGSYATITYAKLRHPWTAKLALAFNAKQFSSMPEVTLRYRGRIIKVPSNYDPIARTCTGEWDGDSFKDAWSNNPAWCFLDMATNARYGSGRYVPASSLDIWALYEIAQYCDQAVSDGKGGTEPRFQFNCYLSSPEEAFKVLAHMMSVARSALYYGGSLDSPSTSLTAVQDRDETAVSLFSPSNVIGGKFSYSGTPRKTRYTEVTVWWNDPEQAYKLVPVLVVAASSYISRYGVQSTSTVAFGCTSKAQAIREGRRILLTNLLETETVTFSSGLEGMVAFPGARVLIKDPRRDGANQAGRTLDGCTATTLALDRPVTLASGTAYTAYVTLPDGTVQSRAITTAAGTVSSIILASALSSAPNAESQWQITPTATAPTRWRILTVKENKGEDAISYEIAAVQSAPEKYALIDDVGTILPTPAGTPSVFSPVTDLALSSRTAWVSGNVVITLQASWAAPSGATGAEALYRLDGGPWQPMTVYGAGATATLASAGTVDVKVFATYLQGVSPAATGSLAVASVPTTTPASLTITVSRNLPEPNPNDAPVIRGNDRGDVVRFPVNRDEPPGVQQTVNVTAKWVHTDPHLYALKGFRAVLFRGTDPNVTSAYITEPCETGPECRCAVLATLPDSTAINAAVQSVYLDGNESAWRLADGTVALDPDTVQLGTAASVAEAKALADAAQGGVDTLNADDTLSRAKKPAAITDYNAEVQVRAQLQSAALACSPQVDHSDYTNALNTLATFLGGLSPSWTDLTQDTPLGNGGGATMRSRWSTIAQQRQVLQNSINQAQATKASNDAISAAAQDAASKVSTGLTTAAQDATTKATQAKSDAVAQINTAVGGKVAGAADAADAVGKLLALAQNTDAAARTANLVKNGTSEDPSPSGLEAAGITTDRAYTGTKCRKLIVPTNGTASLDVACFPVQAGEWYTADAVALANNGVNVSLDIIFKTAAGGRTGSGSHWDARIQGLPAWGALNTFTAQAPSDAITATIQIQASSPGSGGNAYFDNIWVERKPNSVLAAQAAADAAKLMPTFATPADRPALPNAAYPAGFGPILTSSDWSLWKVNAAGTDWDRILFATTGFFGKITVDQLDVTEGMKAAIADIPYLKSTLIEVIAGASATGPGGKTQIGPEGIKTKSILASHMVLTNTDNLIPNPSCSPTNNGVAWPSGSYEGAAIATDTPSAGSPPAGSRKLSVSGSAGAISRVTIAKFAASAGDVFSASALAYASQGSNVNIRVTYCNAAGAGIGTDGGPWDSAVANAPYWLETKNGSTPAPVGTASATVELLLQSVTGAAINAWFGNLCCRSKVDADLYVDGSVTAKAVGATELHTNNFTQAVDTDNGGIYAATGAALVVNTASTPAIIADSAGLKIGKRPFTDYWFRLLNAIDGSYSGGVLVWRGNNDTNTRGGAPNIECLDVAISQTYSRAMFRWHLQPTAANDNLDGMKQARIQIFPSAGGAAPSYTTYAQLSDRYYNSTTHNSASNAAWGDVFWGDFLSNFGSTVWDGSSFTGHLLIDISNSYGWSAQRWFHPTSSGWYSRNNTPPSGAPAGGSGGGGGGTGGGGCPAPWVPICLASGITIPAGRLIEGMEVLGVDETTREPRVGIVRDIQPLWVDRVRVVLADGRDPEFTHNHRVALATGTWIEVEKLVPGDLLAAQRESRVMAVIHTGKGQVVSFVVEGCHTYFSDDVLSHNAKNMTP